MKKLMLLAAFAVIGFVIAPQAQAYEPYGVGIYTESSNPLDFSVPGATLGSKVGEASCKTVMGIVNWGDCSVRTAMKNGKISRVTAADWEKKYVIVYGRKTLKVYGN